MKPNKLRLFIAILLGLIVALMLRSYIREVKRSSYGGMKLVKAIVAKKDLPQGTVLEESLIAKRSIPREFLTGDFIKVQEYRLILGQKIQAHIRKGEPILWSHVGAEERKGFSSGIPEKKRALTIGVDELTGVGGMISPHDHVDILITYAGSSKAPEPPEVKTITLLQDIPVLAVGRRASEYQPISAFAERTGYSAVTLCLSPLEAELLAFAQEHGRLYLTLRNPQDREKQELPEINLDYLGKKLP